MRHSQTSRKFAKAFFAFVTIGMAAACADSVIAPPTSIVSFKAPAGFDVVVGVKTFWAGTQGTIQGLGAHTINIPAGAICDPLLSSYGSGEWDMPCTPLDRPILITATMMEDDNGHPYVDFQPALRFVPTKEVNLYLRSGKGEKARALTIWYCNNLGFCVDESLTDASLATRRVGRSAILVRRIKHFSGYVVAAGEECPGTVTEELDGTLMCWVDDLLGFGRRSGYMVASGLGKSGTTTDTTAVAKNRYDH